MIPVVTIINWHSNYSGANNNCRTESKYVIFSLISAAVNQQITVLLPYILSSPSLNLKHQCQCLTPAPRHPASISPQSCTLHTHLVPHSISPQRSSYRMIDFYFFFYPTSQNAMKPRLRGTRITLISSSRELLDH